MSVKLHTCGVTWLKIDAHPCWTVEKALKERGVEFEAIREPTFPRSRRKAVEEHTDQRLLPVIENADGTWIRDDSRALIERINAGEFD
jgi:tRNA isopentenyl-2-thiomethyl-A-37 hydroxylase MiaE